MLWGTEEKYHIIDYRLPTLSGSLVSARFCQIAHEMAETCEAVIKQDFPDTPIQIHRVKEPREAAMGNGTGIM